MSETAKLSDHSESSVPPWFFRNETPRKSNRSNIMEENAKQNNVENCDDEVTKNKKKNKKYKRRKDTKRKFQVVRAHLLQKLLARHKRLEQESRSSYSHDGSIASVDSWQSRKTPLKSLKKIMKKKLKPVDLSSAFIATLSVSSQQPDQDLFSDEDSFENNDVIGPDVLVMYDVKQQRKSKMYKRKSRETLTVDEMASYMQEQESGTSSFDIDLELGRKYKILDLQKMNSTNDEISLVTAEEDFYSNETISSQEKLKTGIITAASLLGVTYAAECLRTFNTPLLQVASALSLSFASYASYQQYHLSKIEEQNARAQKLIRKSDYLINQKRILLEKIEKLKQKRARLYEVEDQLFALAAGTPNSTNTLIAKAKTAKYLSFQLKIQVRAQIIYTIFKYIHISSRKTQDLALTSIGVELMIRKLSSLEHIQFFPLRFEASLKSSNYSIRGLLLVMKELFDDDTPPEEQIFKLPYVLPSLS